MKKTQAKAKDKLPNECAVTGKEARPVLVPQPHGGALMRPWTKEDRPPGKGQPKGFVPPSVAYAVCSVLSTPDLMRIQRGELPADPRWPRTRYVSSGYSAMAGQILAAAGGATPAAREYADRVEGPIVQRQEIAQASYLVELPSFASDAQIWATARSAPRLAAAQAVIAGEGGLPALPGGEGGSNA